MLPFVAASEELAGVSEFGKKETFRRSEFVSNAIEDLSVSQEEVRGVIGTPLVLSKEERPLSELYEEIDEGSDSSE